MVPLDSPRWSDFGAQHIPELIHALADEVVPQHSQGWHGYDYNSSPWERVYLELCDGIVDTKMYLAFPHIVAIAECGRLEKRVETLILAGHIRTHCGPPFGHVPTDLVDEFETAMQRVRRWSLETIRAAKVSRGKLSELPQMLLGFGGLRHEYSGYLLWMDWYYAREWQLEVEVDPVSKLRQVLSGQVDFQRARQLRARGTCSSENHVGRSIHVSNSH